MHYSENLPYLKGIMVPKLRLLPLLLLFIVFSACKKPEAKVLAKPIIAVSILPQTWFSARIAGDRVQTMVLVGPGQNPHTYEPSPKQMAELAEAQVWVLSGTEFEISLCPKIKALFPKLLIVDGTAGVRFRSLETHEEFEEAHDAVDRHTWLGWENAKILAAHIRDALSSIDNRSALFFQNQYEHVVHEIDAEFVALHQELAQLKGKTVFVYHPSFGYFLDEFGMIQEAVETGGKEPTPRELSKLIEKAKQEKVAAIFVQVQFPLQAAKTIAASINAVLIPLDPLSPDWLANIRVMGTALKNAAALQEMTL